MTWGVYKGWGPYFNGSVGGNHVTLTRNYYGADQKLRVVQVHDETTNGSTWTQDGSYAEYRYDPLGRRIMERTRRDSVCFSTSHDCESTLTRFVWAGDQLLWEMRVPGGNNVTGTALEATSSSASPFYGRVSYFHAGGIDRPLLITKEGVESVVPRETWRGQFHAGTSPTTGARRDCPVGTQSNCLQIAWPGMQTNAAHSWGGEQPDIRVWYGGLVDGMRDASGQMYMRNRYYDPATGQFTQTDPIGLAGGLNAYGFAAGDPVSYADPYGLKVEFETRAARTLWTELQRRITAARNSRNADERDAAFHLSITLQGITSSENTLRLDVGPQSGIDWLRVRGMAGAITYMPFGGLFNDDARVVIDPARLRHLWNVNAVVALGHELGHAHAIMYNLADKASPAIRTDNYARILSGCLPVRTTERQSVPPCN